MNTIDQRPLVVWCSGASWGGIVGTDRHMATALAEFADILWVDPPISPITLNAVDATRLPLPRLARLGDSFFRLSVKTIPFHTRSVLRPLSALLVRAQIRRALAQLRRQPDVFVVSHLSDLFEGHGSNALRVFYGTDDYVGGAELMGLSRQAVEEEEKRQLAKADVVVAVSDHLAARWHRIRTSGSMIVIPNGVSTFGDCSTCVIPTVVARLPRPIAGFVGHLSARIDIALMESVVRAGCSLLLIGPHDKRWEPERFRALVSDARVKWMGPLSFDELPPFLMAIDVGITPYMDSDFNRAAFPLKTLEYLAAGKPVVSTDLPSVRWLSTDLVRVAGADSFGKVVAEVSRTSSHDVGRRLAFAESHSWRERAKAFAGAIGLHAAQRPPSLT